MKVFKQPDGKFAREERLYLPGLPNDYPVYRRFIQTENGEMEFFLCSGCEYMLSLRVEGDHPIYLCLAMDAPDGEVREIGDRYISRTGECLHVCEVRKRLLKEYLKRPECTARIRREAEAFLAAEDTVELDDAFLAGGETL